MRKPEVRKSVVNKLTPMQRDAIAQNSIGNSYPLIRCIFACVKAIDKITAMGAMGATTWATASASHHIEMRDYLFAQLKDGEIRKQVYEVIFKE